MTFTDEEVLRIGMALETGNDDLIADLEGRLLDRYMDEMPYLTQKARDGDPMQWIFDRISYIFDKYKINGLKNDLNEN